jgi:phage terminase large subunit-like protein
VEAIVARYQHSALGRQEIYGLLVLEVEGALWRIEIIDHVKQAPEIAEVVVAVDPPGSSHGAEAGIVVVGIEAGPNDPGKRHAYVLEDCSIQGPPEVWGSQAVAAYHRHGATYVLGEVNFGGEMVGSIIGMADPSVRFKAVRVGRGQGKWARAEPVAALYAMGRCHHVGYFPELESQMCSWVDGDSVSPDRLDALCHACAYLMPDLSVEPARAWSPAQMTMGRPTSLSRFR